MPEIPCVGISKLFRDSGDRSVRIGKKLRRMFHLEFLNVLAEAAPGAFLDDPLDLAFTVVEEFGKPA